MSGDTDDAVISSLSTRTQAWLKGFQIPKFSYETELQLEKGNAEYRTKKIILTVSSKMKSDILQKLAEEIFRFKAYPQDANFCEVSEALIKKHPCLQEPGSYNGWKQRLKYKMGNYRTQMKLYGCPELAVNSVKNKAREGDRVYPAKNMKKAKRAEANDLPDLPQDETPENLEVDREMLMREAKKRNNKRLIRELMAKTFAYRRHEVVKEQPRVEDFMKRWPALFKVNEINAEFLQITTISLQSKFLAQLDKYTNKLTSIIRHKGGAARYKTASFIQAVDQKNNVNIRREFVLRSLIYLGEDDKDLIKEYLDTLGDDAEREMKTLKMAIFVIRKEGEGPFHTPKEVGIDIEGVEVLNGLQSVAAACPILFGLMYAVNLRYPKELKLTFEVFQKVFMELEGNKKSPRVQNLSSKLLSSD